MWAHLLRSQPGHTVFEDELLTFQFGYSQAVRGWFSGFLLNLPV